ncbi:uncharacterized protein METZ01_LOCUS118983 [marine metagenome]|uniref:Uncharacterized protein n=1 Tax=marine metagenome TaxID=408172 RepID=A0A381XN11_9ZZZZ
MEAKAKLYITIMKQQRQNRGLLMNPS